MMLRGFNPLIVDVRSKVGSTDSPVDCSRERATIEGIIKRREKERDRFTVHVDDVENGGVLRGRTLEKYFR